MSNAPLVIGVLVRLNVSVNWSCASGALRKSQVFIVSIQASKRQQVTDWIDILQILMNSLVGCCGIYRLDRIFPSRFVSHAYNNIPSHTSQTSETSKLFQRLEEFSTFSIYVVARCFYKITMDEISQLELIFIQIFVSIKNGIKASSVPVGELKSQPYLRDASRFIGDSKNRKQKLWTFTSRTQRNRTWNSIIQTDQR